MKTRKVKKGFKKTRRGGGFLLKTDKSNLQELMDIISSMMDDFNKTFRKKKHREENFNKFIDGIVYDVNETNIDKLKRVAKLYKRELDEKAVECDRLPKHYHWHIAKCLDEYDEEFLEKNERINKLNRIIDEYERNMSNLVQLYNENYITNSTQK